MIRKDKYLKKNEVEEEDKAGGYNWNSMEGPQKIKNRIIIWPSSPTPGHLYRENHNSTKHMHYNAHWTTVYNSQDVEAT